MPGRGGARGWRRRLGLRAYGSLVPPERPSSIASTPPPRIEAVDRSLLILAELEMRIKRMLAHASRPALPPPSSTRGQADKYSLSEPSRGDHAHGRLRASFHRQDAVKVLACNASDG